MKVLMFGWEFPPHISGGLGTACYGITKGLQAQQVSIDFVLPGAGGAESGAQSQPANVIDASSVSVEAQYLTQSEQRKYINSLQVDTILRPYLSEQTYREQLQEVSAQQSQIGTAPGTSFPFKGGYGDDLISEVYRLCAVATQLGAETDAQVIHAHDWMTFPAAAAAKRTSGLPLVAHVHATSFDRASDGGIDTRVYEVEKEGMHAADLIIAVSERTKDIIVRNYEIDPNKVRVVYNAVDQQDIDHAAMPDPVFKEPVVLFLGRVTTQKGPSYFLEAARLVLEQNKNVRFVMAGAGDMFTDMVRLCARMRLQDRFHFTGFLKGKELEHIFAISDIFVMPSVSEPFGIVPMEAMQYDIPVIISKQSGVAELFPHAVQVDFWDTKLLASSILEFINNPKKRDDQVEQNKAILARMRWESAALEIIDAYESLIPKGGEAS